MKSPSQTVAIGVLASGSGSNFEAIASAVENGKIPGARVAILICNKPDAGVFGRAHRLHVESLLLEPKNFPSRAAYFERVRDEFKSRGVRLVCLAGFLLKVEAPLLEAFSGRILNIHPALLPSHGGPGMYGHYVHEAVVKSREKVSGCTVHVVDEHYDHGPVIAQAQVPVLPEDTPETLAARVLKEEHRIYPEAVKLVVDRILETA